MRMVSFGMYWECYGRQTVLIPDDIPDDEDSVREYILSVFDEIPLPAGDYVQGSDELDEESIILEGCI